MIDKLTNVPPLILMIGLIAGITGGFAAHDVLKRRTECQQYVNALVIRHLARTVVVDQIANTLNIPEN